MLDTECNWDGPLAAYFEAAKQAVQYCRDHDILKEFLEKNGTEEVANMLMTEWVLNVALESLLEESIEEGRTDEKL